LGVFNVFKAVLQTYQGGESRLPRTLENKQEIVADLKQHLSETQLALIVNYSGLTVSEITTLRNQLRPTGTICKVTKNTLMGIAVEGDPIWAPMKELLKGTNAFLLVKDDFKAAVKAYQDFQKTAKKTELVGGVMEGRVLKEADVKAVTELPSKPELMARIAGGIKAMPSRLAVGINAVPTKVAVGINAVPTKLVRALKAVSEKDSSSESAENT
jgi:large subunit ribosomal protein L10